MVEKSRMPLKERMKIPRTPMPELDAKMRSRGFDEVNLGFAASDAVLEATRCVSCAKPSCVVECPVGVKIKEILELIYAGEFLDAAAKMREDNPLPAVTGRVCPQENQCEGGCVLGRRGQPVAIGNLERFIADFERVSGQLGLPAVAPPTGKCVAIVGSGPAGLAAAGDLVQKGHRVRVFEALHEIGGVLVYGIPEFRLPKSIVKGEVENLRRMGVEFETNVIVGKSVTIDELMHDEGYSAVFVATGAGLPQFLGIPGEHLNGVYSANEFLTRVNLMRAYLANEYDQPVYDCNGRDVIVVGGGNTAMDAVRCARRLGARRATLVYRRSEAEMPARTEEVKHARDEGIEFRMLTAPVEFVGDEKGWLTGARCVRMELGAPDESGRCRPVQVAGSEHVLAANVAIIGVGTTANPLVQSTTPELKTTSRNYIVADPETMRTSKRGVFAGGDIVTGSATVILAMGAGRKAARSIHEYLSTGQW
ncbi:MAG TPA: NADPH-dependent glutamate synthase [Terracidiphilus sp.]|nr:NADPH-dependent glutamate synthase [Terracidiphilus sp.]